MIRKLKLIKERLFGARSTSASATAGVWYDYFFAFTLLPPQKKNDVRPNLVLIFSTFLSISYTWNIPLDSAGACHTKKKLILRVKYCIIVPQPGTTTGLQTYISVNKVFMYIVCIGSSILHFFYVDDRAADWTHLSTGRLDQDGSVSCERYTVNSFIQIHGDFSYQAGNVYWVPWAWLAHLEGVKGLLVYYGA